MSFFVNFAKTNKFFIVLCYNLSMSKEKVLKKAKTTKTNLAKTTPKPAKTTTKGQNAKNKQPTNKAAQTSGTKKTQINQTANPFVDKYLEFYDDIKIPSRRYDW